MNKEMLAGLKPMFEDMLPNVGNLLDAIEGSETGVSLGKKLRGIYSDEIFDNELSNAFKAVARTMEQGAFAAPAILLTNGDMTTNAIAIQAMPDDAELLPTFFRYVGYNIGQDDATKKLLSLFLVVAGMGYALTPEQFAKGERPPDTEMKMLLTITGYTVDGRENTGVSEIIRTGKTATKLTTPKTQSCKDFTKRNGMMRNVMEGYYIATIMRTTQDKVLRDLLKDVKA